MPENRKAQSQNCRIWNRTSVCDFSENFLKIIYKVVGEGTEQMSKMKKLLKNALNYGKGIRILKADFVEIVLSFILSANNNIKRFKRTI